MTHYHYVNTWFNKRDLEMPENLKFESKENEKHTKPNLFYTRFYAKACKEYTAPISATLRQGHTAAYAGMLHRWRSDGNTDDLADTCI